MSYQQAFTMDDQNAVILKFSLAATTQPTAVPAAQSDPAQSTYAADEEPMIFSLVDYLPSSTSTMPPLFQIEMIEAQYNQFMEESAVHLDSNSRLWEEVKPGGIRAM